MPWLNTCCNCCSLRAGTLFTGTMSMVVSLASLFIIVFVRQIKFKAIVDILPSDIFKIIVVLNLVMTILISLLLVIGAIKRNKWLMLPWVVLGILIAVGMVISVIFTAVVSFIKSQIFNGVFWLIGGLIGTAIYTYLWVVVYSFYQLIEEEKGKGPYNFPYGPRR